VLILKRSGSDVGHLRKQTLMNSSGLVVRTWNDAPICRRDSDGFADATAMCRANGKDLFDYQRLDRTAAYTQALSDSLGIPADQLVVTTTTGPNHLRGTWIHPRLAVDLARWLNPAFAVWMDGWFLEQLEQAQQHQPTIIYAIDPRRHILPGRRGDVRSMDDLCRSDRMIVREVYYARVVQRPSAVSCRTCDLLQALDGECAQSTVRNALTRLRALGLVTKRGWGWHLTHRGAALAEQEERAEAA
jgi:hypothetical protein